MGRHPLHPMLVHFPIACWSLAVVADMAALLLGVPAGQWAPGLLAVGCATAVLAMLAGMLEVGRVPEGAALRTLYAHMALMLLALCVFAARLFWGRQQGLVGMPDAIALLLDGAGFALLAVGGWYGGKLVYSHGVGSRTLD